MALLRPDYDRYDFQAIRLQSVAGGITSLSTTHQKIIAEVIALRLFDLLVGLIVSVAEKVAAGAVYLDGSPPALLIPAARSRKSAITLFRTYGRPREKTTMRWTMPSEIHDNVGKMIDPNDNFRQVITRHAGTIDDLRKIRNRIAHNNAKSRQQYRTVISHYYGAVLNHVTPGTLLLTTSRWVPPLLQQYLMKASICAKELVKK